MNDELKSIITEIKEDIMIHKPSEVKLKFNNNEIQIVYDGYNYSSYAISKEEYNILEELFS